MERQARSNPDHPEYQYLDLLTELSGTDAKVKKSQSTGEQLAFKFGVLHKYDLDKGFPLLTTKDVFWKGVKHELIWFLRGDTNIRYLVNNGVGIWNKDAYKRYAKEAKSGKEPNLDLKDFISKVKEDEDFGQKWGELGPVYGSQWRRWKTSDGRKVDQLKWVVDKLRDPRERYRKHLVFTAWNPEYIYENAKSEDEEMALPPCHMLAQLDVYKNEKTNQDELSLSMNQRSCDLFLGVPFNIASYSLLTHMIAQVTGLKAKEFVHYMANAHVYKEHDQAVKEQITREPRPFPTLVLNPDVKELEDFKYEDIKIENYHPHPAIAAKMIAVGGRLDHDKS